MNSLPVSRPWIRSQPARRGSRGIFLVFVLVAGLVGNPFRAWATAGLAEWDVQTPGTNMVCHSDPFIADHGTCLRPRDAKPGESSDPAVYVSHLEWWQYFPGHVVGQAKRGHFMFNEVTRKVEYLETEAKLLTRIRELSLGNPMTRRLTDKDGWNLSWGPVIRAQMEQRKKSAEYKSLTKVQKEELDRQLDQFKEPDIRPSAP